MKTKWISEEFPYDGTQLRSLFAYLGHGVLGDSAVAWVGPCDISFDHMVDGEDLLDRSEIRGSKMLHFILEVFDRDLFAGVCLQRLMASLAGDLLREQTGKNLRRSGDDLFLDNRKLSISVAAKSPISTVVHFAMNVANAGTPVATCALQDDFGVAIPAFAGELLSRVAAEYESIVIATRKVRPVS